MKKLIQIIASVVLGIGLSMGVASAEHGGCHITNGNGTDSTNECIIDTETNIRYVCRNGVLINVENDQSANSGNATANGNTTVGNVTSGDALNEGQITTNVNASCAKAASANPTTTTPPAGGGQGVRPSGGGQGAGPGGGQGAGSVAGASTKIASLPNTGVNSTVESLGIATGAVGLLGVVTQACVMAYRRFALKN